MSYLNPTQMQQLATGLRASTDPIVVAARGDGINRNDTALANWCNSASAFIVYKTSVTVQQVGRAMLQSDVANLTTANTNRLQVMQVYSGGTFDPTSADLRAAFADIFSVASAAGTRAALTALWQRAALNAERFFATGTGTTGTPGLLAWEGTVSVDQVSNALDGRYDRG